MCSSLRSLHLSGLLKAGRLQMPEMPGSASAVQSCTVAHLQNCTVHRCTAAHCTGAQCTAAQCTSAELHSWTSCCFSLHLKSFTLHGASCTTCLEFPAMSDSSYTKHFLSVYINLNLCWLVFVSTNRSSIRDDTPGLPLSATF